MRPPRARPPRQALKSSQRVLRAPPPLTLGGVLAALRGMAGDRGQGSAGRRQAAVARLLRACRRAPPASARARPRHQPGRRRLLRGRCGARKNVLAPCTRWGVVPSNNQARHPATIPLRDVEIRYVVRTLVSNLRVGAGWRSVVGPLGKAALIHREGPGWGGRVPKKRLDEAGAAAGARGRGGWGGFGLPAAPRPCPAARRPTAGAGLLLRIAHHARPPPPGTVAAYLTCPNLPLLATELLAAGPFALAAAARPRAGVPVQPMLASPATSAAGALARLGRGPVLAEFKYDGMRAQIHVVSATEVGGCIAAYSQWLSRSHSRWKRF